MAEGLLSKGIKLSYMDGVEFSVLPDLQEIPELGGDVEKVEVTTLDDSARRYIAGIKDYGDLEFVFLYDGGADSSYNKLRGLEDTGESTEFKIEFPDGVSFTFSGFVSTKIQSVGVNAPLLFNAAIALNSDIQVSTAV